MPLHALVVLLGLRRVRQRLSGHRGPSSSQLIFFTNRHDDRAADLADPAGGVPRRRRGAVRPGRDRRLAASRQLARLEAYRLDLLGSLLGIVVFTGCPISDAPPLVWFTIVGVLFVGLLGRPATSVSVTLLLGVADHVRLPAAPRHRGLLVAVLQGVDGQGDRQRPPTAWSIDVNGVPHQRLTSAALRAAEEPYYLQPYEQIPGTPRPRADRRRRHGDGRRDRAGPGRRAGGRGRDRPDPAALRRDSTSRTTPTSDPRVSTPRRRRSRVPRDDVARSST